MFCLLNDNWQSCSILRYQREIHYRVISFLFFRTRIAFEFKLQKSPRTTDFRVPQSICTMFNVMVDAKAQSAKLCAMELSQEVKNTISLSATPISCSKFSVSLSSVQMHTFSSAISNIKHSHNVLIYSVISMEMHEFIFWTNVQYMHYVYMNRSYICKHIYALYIFANPFLYAQSIM